MIRAMSTAALVCLMGVAVAGAQVRSWKIDPAHSEADFSIQHMSISTVHGAFHAVSGVVKYDPLTPAQWSVDATIQVDSVDTGVAPRDKDLRGPAFFDVAKYPTMTFKSTGVQSVGDHFELKGDLTLHGVTKPVMLTMELPSKEQTGMDGHSVHRGFVATTTINRKDFGLNWNGMLKSGDHALGDQVKIEIDIEAVLE